MAVGGISAKMEAVVLDEFRDVLTRADHPARMDRHTGAKDFGAAKRLGSNEVAIVKASPRRIPSRPELCSTRFPARHAGIWAYSEHSPKAPI
jgi:hypothetical protein